MKWLWKMGDGPQHSIIAAGIMAAFGLPLWALGCPYPAVVGALFGVVWFHGREVASFDATQRG